MKVRYVRANWGHVTMFLLRVSATADISQHIPAPSCAVGPAVDPPDQIQHFWQPNLPGLSLEWALNGPQGLVQTRSKITTIHQSGATRFTFLIFCGAYHYSNSNLCAPPWRLSVFQPANYSITVPHELRGFSSSRSKRTKAQNHNCQEELKKYQ